MGTLQNQAGTHQTAVFKPGQPDPGKKDVCPSYGGTALGPDEAEAYGKAPYAGAVYGKIKGPFSAGQAEPGIFLCFRQ